MSEASRLETISQIAIRIGIGRSTVAYLIDHHRVLPAIHSGNCRLFDVAAQRRIDELAAAYLARREEVSE